MEFEIRQITYEEAAVLGPEIRKTSVTTDNLPGAVWFGAFAEGRLIGTGSVVPMKGGNARLKGFWIHPDFRRMGIGTALTNERIRYAAERPGAFTHLTSYASKDSYSIYMKLGFKEMSRNKVTGSTYVKKWL